MKQPEEPARQSWCVWRLSAGRQHVKSDKDSSEHPGGGMALCRCEPCTSGLWDIITRAGNEMPAHYSCGQEGAFLPCAETE